MTPAERAVERAGRRLGKARAAVELAADELGQAVRAAAAEGASEWQLVELSGVSRMTVRRMLGRSDGKRRGQG